MSWWLVTFCCFGPARYLSHLDRTRALQRTFARAGIDVGRSRGLRPKASVALPLPLPVGAAGRRELAVVEVVGQEPDAAALARLRAAAPPGLQPLRVASAGDRHPRPKAWLAEYTCEVYGDADALATAVARFAGADHVMRERVTPKGRRTLDLKEYVVDPGVQAVAGGVRLGFSIRHRAAGAARPQDYVDLIAEWAGVDAVMRNLERLRVAWEDMPRAQGAGAEGVDLCETNEESGR